MHRKESYDYFVQPQFSPQCHNTAVFLLPWFAYKVDYFGAELRLNKVMMHRRVSSCYCLKWAAHKMTVTLQVVHTKRPLHVNKSAKFLMTMHAYRYCCIKMIWNFMPSDQRTEFHNFPLTKERKEALLAGWLTESLRA